MVLLVSTMLGCDQEGKKESSQELEVLQEFSEQQKEARALQLEVLEKMHSNQQKMLKELEKISAGMEEARAASGPPQVFRGYIVE